jgi:hypothetical protein
MLPQQRDHQMRRTIAFLWQQHRVLLVAFALGGAATLFFAIRLVAFWVYWSDPDHHRMPLEGWMTVGYVARSWQVPPEAVYALIPADLVPGTPQTLAELATQTGQDLPALIARLEPALAALPANPEAPPEAPP